MTTSTKTMNVSGDKLKIHWDGNVWVAPCNGTQHARAEAAMRQELYRYLSDCDELPDDCDDASDLDLADYGTMKSK